jgi:4-hydroxy-3-methylbut-2-enyl diphosphate reductase
MKEAEVIGKYMLGEISADQLMSQFTSKVSEGFNPAIDLQRVGVVNQTTMLASETQEIADYFKNVIQAKHAGSFQEHFADTRDTLCYATNDNQQATLATLECKADLALVVGGYNSSNTSQIVTILSEKFPTYFICDAGELLSDQVIRHYHYEQHRHAETSNWLPAKDTLRILISSGASCPDTVLEEVVERILVLRPTQLTPKDALDLFMPAKA